ncbi:HAMP domain-containing histidine kinase [Candidatus Saccharibacteria bacterium]|nr:HAMP domain-containing histidine kinase [Candidatus Saccharibacteria bacterium]
MLESPDRLRRQIDKEVKRRTGKLLTQAQKSLLVPPAVIFVAVLAATLFGWQAANVPLGEILLLGTFTAALIAYIVLLLIRARGREMYLQKERAIKIAQDELLSLASHQLRTPATGVKQYVGMVLQGFAGEVPEAQRALLEKAYASNDRQLRIINEILHMAKIGTGRIVLAKKPINLNELVTDVVNEQRGDIEAAHHTLAMELPKQTIMLSADIHMLRMAIENLLSNAIKYTPRGGTITVRLYKEEGDVKIEIEDTGIGIKPEDIGKIFRQFVRLENEISQQVSGTGIGLYLAKNLVELHGGSVDVTSQPGLGSTFTISLPMHVPNEDSMKNLTARKEA